MGKILSITSMKSLSIIIVSWNVRELLRECLRSVIAQQHFSEIEVIVIDNHSRDGSGTMVRDEFPQVTLIQNTRNLGFAKANNQARPIATGKYLLFLNPDTRVPAELGGKLQSILDSHPSVGILSGLVKGPQGERQLSVRRDPTAIAVCLMLLKIHALWPRLRPLARYYALDFSYDKAADVEQVIGAFFCVRREALEAADWFDQSFFLWFEEVDLCLRIRDAGWKVRYDPAVEITHYGGQSFGQLMSWRLQRIFNRSARLYAKKHFSFWGKLGIALLYWPSLGLAAIEPLLRKLITPRSPA